MAAGKAPAAAAPAILDKEDSDIELPILQHAVTAERAFSTDSLMSLSHQGPATPASVEAGRPADKGTRQFPLQEKAAGRGGWVAAVFHFCLSNWERALVLAVIITLIVLVSVKGFSIFGTLLTFFERQNNWKGWGIFLAVYTVNVALFLPGVVLILGAGFVFGFPKGLLAVWIGGGIGQPLAFLLARYLLRDIMSGYLRAKWRKWDVLDRAIQEEGWKLLLLLRLSPAVPYNFLNIAMATTGMPFWVFAVVSFFGIIPECSILCYFGSLSENISQIASGKAGPSGPITYVLLGVTCFFMITAVAWSTFVVRRAFKRAEADMLANPASELRSAQHHRDSGNDSQEEDEEALILQGPSARRRDRTRLHQGSAASLHSDDSPWSPHESPSPRRPPADSYF